MISFGNRRRLIILLVTSKHLHEFSSSLFQNWSRGIQLWIAVVMTQTSSTRMCASQCTSLCRPGSADRPPSPQTPPIRPHQTRVIAATAETMQQKRPLLSLQSPKGRRLRSHHQQQPPQTRTKTTPMRRYAPDNFKTVHAHGNVLECFL